MQGVPRLPDVAIAARDSVLMIPCPVYRGRAWRCSRTMCTSTDEYAQIGKVSGFKNLSFFPPATGGVRGPRVQRMFCH